MEHPQMTTLVPFLSRHRLAALLATAGLALAGCHKAVDVAADKVVETAMEKKLEADMKANGAKEAKVDLAAGTAKVTTVDKDGKTQVFEMGNSAAVTEADIGLPFYPGATVDAQHVTKSLNGDETSAIMPLQTTDAPDKVAAFYRERMKALAGGKQLMDMSPGDGSTMLMLSDEAGRSAIQVSIAPGKNGEPASITLITHRKKV
jgi:hypothetical protein